MRRFAILVAIYGACCSSWATAAPVERPPGRLQRYDQGAPGPKLRRESATAARYKQGRRPSSLQGRAEPVRRAAYRQSRSARYEQVDPTYYEEDVPPGPVADGPIVEEWSEGGPWEYDDGFYDDGYCNDCGNQCCVWGPTPGFWGRAEYIYWWLRGSQTPPLVTTSPDGTSQAQAGVLPNATVLFGGGRLNTTGRSGGRFTLGYWFDSCDYTGIEASVFFLGKVNQQYYNSSQGSPILARPFFNVVSQANDAQLIAYPNIVTGSIQASATSQLYGGDVNLRRGVYADCWMAIQLLAGYRYFGLTEGLNIQSNTTSVDPNGSVPVGTTFAIFDQFKTRNQFNGAQLGISTQLTNGPWTLDLLGKLAIGAVAQRVQINGGTVTTTPGGTPTSGSGGILALDSNIGTYNRKRFSVLPALNADLRYQLTPLWRLNVGYTAMFVTNVVRPGNQIDMNVDPNQFPPSSGGTQPKFVFRDSDIWLQGINFGIECNF